jgi:phosphate-selective porin OprO/OprP
MHHLTRSFLAFAVIPAVAISSFGAEADDIAALRAQVQQLEQQLKIVSRKLELQEERAAATPPAPKISVTDKGVTVASADNANFIKFGGLVQLDSRLFFNDGGGLANNQFTLRRARLISQGQFAKNYGYLLTTEFGGSSVSILDAAFTVTVDPALQFKFGKFKVPIGLELLQSDSWTFFNERSLVTNLVPNRDVGVQAGGDLLGGRLSYQAGVFGGVPDAGSTTNSDFDNEKDVAGRIVASPFKDAIGSPAQGLTFAVAGSIGRQKTTGGRTSGYKTDGQQTFFAYGANTISDGQVWRVAPQADYRFGPFGAIGEYVLSTVNLRPSATGAKTEVRNRGWQLSGGFVLTGEDSSFTGVVPHDNFNPSAGTWGAFEVVARFSNLKVDDNAFPLLASIASNADEATAWGAGLNWYLSKTVAFKLDYYHTQFGFAPHAPATPTAQILRQDENAFISRFQLSF